LWPMIKVGLKWILESQKLGRELGMKGNIFFTRGMEGGGREPEAHRHLGLDVPEDLSPALAEDETLLSLHI
jgi:hypothetical protein